jgi:hypothetical protein
MKKSILLSVITLLFVSITTQAQFGRNNLRDKAERLVSSSAELASKLHEDLRRSFTTNSRSDLEGAFLASQIEVSARLFEQMVGDNRRDSELRDAVSIISDLVRRAPSFGSQSYYWSDLKRAFDDVQRDVGGYSSGNENEDYDRRPIIGRVRWRGTVDDEVQLIIRGNSVEVKTISGSTYNNGNYNFTSNLPTRKVDVFVDKKKGRGKAEVIQQPSRANDFTTVIQIRDKDGGARDYEVEVFWREGNR